MDKKTKSKSISVVLPCYNEEKNIPKQIASAVSTLEKITDDYEIIVVNDGSTDSSKTFLSQLAEKNNKIKVFSHNKKLGYGATLNSGFKHATKSLIFYTSMDNQYDVNQINDFLSYIPNYDIVIGCRSKRKDSLCRIFIAKSYNLLIRTLYGLDVKDIDCAFKLFKKEVISNLKIKSRYSFIDAEILLKAKRKGYSVKQLEVKHFPRIFGRTTVGFKTIALTLTEIIRFWKELHKLKSN